jgi:transcription termination factor NusB
MSGSKEKRRQARIQAVQHLYAREMRGVLGVAEKVEPAGEHAEPAGELTPFALAIITGAQENLERIDALLVDWAGRETNDDTWQMYEELRAARRGGAA